MEARERTAAEPVRAVRYQIRAYWEMEPFPRCTHRVSSCGPAQKAGPDGFPSPSYAHAGKGGDPPAAKRLPKPSPLGWPPLLSTSPLS